MNKFILSLLTILFSCALYGQGSDAPLVMNAEGEAWFEGPNGKKSRVYTGIYLTGGGTLSLAASAKVEVIHKEKFVLLDKAGAYPLRSLFGKATGGGFVKRFSNFVGQGLDQSASKAGLESAFQRNQSNAQGNTRGLGDRGLFATAPFGGKLGPEFIHFQWPDDPDAMYYDFSIVDSLEEEIIFQARARGTSLGIDFSELELDSTTTYYWQASAVSASKPMSGLGLGRRGAGKESMRIHFTTSEQKTTSILTELQGQPTYPVGANPGTRHLADAMELEALGFLYAADKSYQNGMKEVPDNPIVVRGYAAFLARWNRRIKAEKLLESLEKN